MRSIQSRLLRLLSLAVAIASPALAADPADEPTKIPAISGPLKANPHPYHFDGGALGNIYVDGIISGIAQFQDNETANDAAFRADASNAQLFIQKNQGELQFYVQTGYYSVQTLGTPFVRADASTDLFGIVPVAYGKWVPNEHVALSAGKLPTLIGSEYTFGFENSFIQEGLLWNQENAVNSGVQLDLSEGKINASFSVNDGFYSDRYSWVSALIAYAPNAHNTFTIAGGGNMDESSRANLATPLLQNNSEILNLIYSYRNGAWSITPYLQYTHVGRNDRIGITDEAETFGGALSGSYAFNDRFSLSSRAEYIQSSGTPGVGTSNLLYGSGSDAWSFTVTPSYQYGIYFTRMDASYVQANDITPGSAFGRTGNADSQARLVVESGVLF